MSDHRKRIALIAAYQPTEALLTIIQQIEDADVTILVIDDGSGSAYEELFAQVSKQAIVLHHPENRGKGCAIKTGLQYVTTEIEAPCTVVTLDADGQHRVEDAVRLLLAAEQKPDTLILGSRTLQQDVPIRSKVGNTITRGIFSLSTGRTIHDTQTGLRAFSSALIPGMLEIKGDRYEYEMNVLLELIRQKIPIEETGIDTIYFDNNAGSHFNTVKDAYRIYKEILKFSASSLCSFLLDYLLYSLLIVLTASLGATVSLAVSNVLARIVSATFNYNLNRKWVFRSETGVAKSLAQYSFLAVIILIANTLALGVLVKQGGMNQYTAKLLIEVLFFILSWFVQRFMIFRRQDVQEDQ